MHPTHRKFIRLLRDRINNGHPIIFTQADIDDYKILFQGTMSMVQRHQGIYRIVLNAIYRPIEEISKDEKVCFVGKRQIDTIEKCFAQAERKHLGTTLISGYIVPVLQSIVRNRQKRRSH